MVLGAMPEAVLMAAIFPTADVLAVMVVVAEGMAELVSES